MTAPLLTTACTRLRFADPGKLLLTLSAGSRRMQAVSRKIRSDRPYQGLVSAPARAVGMTVSGVRCRLLTARSTVYVSRDGAAMTIGGDARIFGHLAVAFGRCMTSRRDTATDIWGDIGVPASDAPMDFAAWFEAFVGGAWHRFDLRSNVPRIGRALIARGRNAADVATTTTLGPNTLIHLFSSIHIAQARFILSLLLSPG